MTYIGFHGCFLARGRDENSGITYRCKDGIVAVYIQVQLFITGRILCARVRVLNVILEEGSNVCGGLQQQKGIPIMM